MKILRRYTRQKSITEFHEISYVVIYRLIDEYSNTGVTETPSGLSGSTLVYFFFLSYSSISISICSQVVETTGPGEKPKYLAPHAHPG